MIEIKAIIQPFKLSNVVEALRGIPNFPGITVTKVQGFGRARGKGATNKIVEDLIDYVPGVKIEIILHDSMLDEIVETIKKNAHTGHKGDGMIFMYDVRDAIRIMTGERGEAAV
jgi:nitrogen regulatory protein P-II 1